MNQSRNWDFGRHPWKENLMVQTEFPKLEEFLIGLQRSWEEAMKSTQRPIGNSKKNYKKTI